MSLATSHDQRLPSVSGPTRLPPELEREILELVAVTSPKMIPTLLRVAHRVFDWIEPHLYRKPPDFFAPTVRYLSATSADASDAWDLAVIERLLAACTGVTNILLINDPMDPLPPIVSLITHLRPTKLSIDILQSLTHLQLLEGTPSSLTLVLTWPHWSELAKLPFLTHLAVRCENDVLSYMVSALPKLQVFVLLAFGLSNIRVDDMPRDPRVYVRPVAGFINLWYAGAQGEDDIWALGNAFVEKKRKGEIEGQCARAL
ncbi:hypothetical protein FB45DRAFT_1055875 [Roridomyces roridus]|uniref:Uncharacterized protein n=1 Tax=Roridomyces roridus TaxID=1738132 RepID=A0AAD7FS92_9AGAR|nr:hypothetical protein FB45DRAFT_1055875 [Roridomyces roridus]